MVCAHLPPPHPTHADYLWICLWHYQGKLIHPTSLSFSDKDGLGPFVQNLWGIVKRDAYPTRYAFNTYVGLIVIQLGLALVMPGVNQEGELYEEGGRGVLGGGGGGSDRG